MSFLYQIKPEGSQAECWKVEEKPLVFGRGDSADADAYDDSLSRSHFLVVREGSEFSVIDLHSSNGTWVNGKRIAAHKLRTSEIIRAGGSAFYFSTTAIAPNAFSIPAGMLDKTATSALRLGTGSS